ncbi:MULTISPECIES: CpaD family pilus assembly lipoprotein [Asticcacaulis]|uniref:CpaD family pilus assembly protein n=1 Tax=Asticcacaulis TaxID=76890 RepID=UPI001FDA3C4B|nr:MULTISPECIES: CpaD family pilus assembly lipoprotein [Asticcacaulis]MBP2159737.1 pilus assembly protein CpaD [Asticcacaulis solisilvae]MDR6800782.1 pilus assembly protein CpaD [Asticcacaulis sp. BE141]
MSQSSVRILALMAPLMVLSACATTGQPETASAPPALPTDQYPLMAERQVRSVSFRINPNGLSENQRRALDQVADDASWTRGDAVDVDIVTAGDLGAVAAGRRIGDYLSAHDVPVETLSQSSKPDQPADIVTVNLTFSRSVIYACNQTWENLTATRSNETYANFGCAVNSNLAAQIADPRDIGRAARATSSDALRKSEILGKYRKGEITSTTKDDQAKGTVSDAVQ